MTKVIEGLRCQHKAISKVLLQLLPMTQQTTFGQRQKQLVIDDIRYKLVELDALIGGSHHRVEELMMQRLMEKDLQVADKKLVSNMLTDHDLLEVFSELLIVRLQAYVVDDGKKASFIQAMNQFVRHYIQHLHREQTQLFELCENSLIESDWMALNAVYV